MININSSTRDQIGYHTRWIKVGSFTRHIFDYVQSETNDKFFNLALVSSDMTHSIEVTQIRRVENQIRNDIENDFVDEIDIHMGRKYLL